MIFGRPASHILAVMFCVVMMFATWRELNDAASTQRLAPYAISYLAALAGLLGGHARWAYYLSAGSLLAVPTYTAVLVISYILQMGIGSVTFFARSLVACAALLLLVHRFAFGRASRQYYGFAGAADRG